MTDAMGVVGQRFQDNEIYVPEMLISARAMKAAVALLEPLLIGSGYKPDSVAVMGTIKGDLHDIGKNLVGMMLKGANFEIFDLGTNVSVDKFMAAAREHKADIIGISALLTTTMGGMRGVIEAVRAADDLPHLRVIVGGAAVTKEFAETDRRGRLGPRRGLGGHPRPASRGRSPRGQGRRASRAASQRRLTSTARRRRPRPGARPGTPR